MPSSNRVQRRPCREIGKVGLQLEISASQPSPVACLDEGEQVALLGGPVGGDALPMNAVERENFGQRPDGPTAGKPAQ